MFRQFCVAVAVVATEKLSNQRINFDKNVFNLILCLFVFVYAKYYVIYTVMTLHTTRDNSLAYDSRKIIKLLCF